METVHRVLTSVVFCWQGDPQNCIFSHTQSGSTHLGKDISQIQSTNLI